LARSDLLGALPPAALEELAGHVRLNEYRAGQVIFREGDLGDSLHIVRSGLVKVVRPGAEGREVTLSTMGPGKTFGELAVLDPAPRSASVVAIDLTHTIEISKAELEELLDRDPGLSRQLLATMARSLTVAKEEVTKQNQVLDLKVQERTQELQESQLEVIRRLGRAAEFRDDDTGLHISRMSRFCARLAAEAGFTDQDCELLLQAAPMHDIGKIGIPDRVLLKPGKLDDEEWEIMKTHPMLGAELLSGATSKVMQLAQGIARAHHEKWNGKGYPDGLKYEDIPILARICTISDVFDALISERPYKNAWTVDDALELIDKQAGEDFDPHLAKLFVGLEPDLRDILARQHELLGEAGQA
ncbi:MAG TPA: HD domain-containing phosphohydrolase, partial [Actinomycetota bacterium]|nr:HD domain-containing phosphohydrolase [Actinomycetota bacterium]